MSLRQVLCHFFSTSNFIPWQDQSLSRLPCPIRLYLNKSLSSACGVVSFSQIAMIQRRSPLVFCVLRDQQTSLILMTLRALRNIHCLRMSNSADGIILVGVHYPLFHSRRHTQSEESPSHSVHILYTSPLSGHHWSFCLPLMCISMMIHRSLIPHSSALLCPSWLYPLDLPFSLIWLCCLAMKESREPCSSPG